MKCNLLDYDDLGIAEVQEEFSAKKRERKSAKKPIQYLTAEVFIILIINRKKNEYHRIIILITILL